MRFVFNSDTNDFLKYTYGPINKDNEKDIYNQLNQGNQQAVVTETQDPLLQPHRTTGYLPEYGSKTPVRTPGRIHIPKPV